MKLRETKVIFVALYCALAATSCKKDARLSPTPNVGDSLNSFAALPPLIPQLVAGKAGTKGFDDATGADARFDGPSNLTVAPDGSLYVVDYYNDAVRKISTQNKVTTLNISPELFGETDLGQYPADVTTLSDGTVGISSYPYIVLYKNGIAKQLTTNDISTGQPGYTVFSGLDKDPTGSFFYFILENRQVTSNQTGSDIVDSYLGTIRNSVLVSKLQPLAHESYSAGLKACANGHRYFINISNPGNEFSLNWITATGNPSRIFANLNLGIVTNFVVNKTGTEIYYVDSQPSTGDVGSGGIIKRIKNNVVTTLLIGGRPYGLALANSEKFLYYSSYDNTVRRIALP